MQLKLLWELQQIDITIAALKLSIEEAPQKSGVEEARAEVELLEQELAASKELHKVERKTLRELEMHIQKLVDQRNQINDGLYSGKTTSAKELEQMQRKMDLLADEKKKYEDQLLNVMEKVEELDDSIKDLEMNLSDKEKVLAYNETKLAAALNTLQSELSAVEEKRREKAEAIEEKNLTRYTMLAEKHHGRPLALVDNDICGGCRVFISSAQRGRLYNPGALVYCENCGRLLIKLDDPQ